MRKEDGREGGKRNQYVSERGDRGLLSFNFDVVFGLKLFPIPPSIAQFVGNDLMNGQNAAIRGPWFFSLL
jgi:hypothetical protein